MNQHTKFLAVVSAVLVLGTALSCAPKGEDVAANFPKLPPLAQVEETAPAFLPISQNFKIAILTFIDQTGKAKNATDPLADMLTTELDATRRFSLFDRSDLRATNRNPSRTTQVEGEDGETITETTYNMEQKTREQRQSVAKSVDGILLGYITSYRNGELTVDYRIVNTSTARDAFSEVDGTMKEELKNLIVASGSGTVKFSGGGERASLQIDRQSMQRIAEQIRGQFLDIHELEGNYQIQKVEGRRITINIGEQDGMRSGFVGFVVRETDLGTLDYLAYFVVVNTFDNASIGYVLTSNQSLSQVRIGSKVLIK